MIIFLGVWKLFFLYVILMLFWIASKTAQEHSKRPQDTHKSAPKGSKRPQERPRRPQEEPKRPQEPVRRPQDLLRSPLKAPKDTKDLEK